MCIDKEKICVHQLTRVIALARVNELIQSESEHDHFKEWAVVRTFVVLFVCFFFGFDFLARLNIFGLVC